MPLIDTKAILSHSLLNEILAEEGIGQSKPIPKDADLQTRMQAKGLGIDEMLSELREIVINGETDNVKLSAIEKALKMAGALKEQPTGPQVSFTVIIRDAMEGVNPILIPREVHS